MQANASNIQFFYSHMREVRVVANRIKGITVEIGADKYQAFQKEIEETRGKLNKYKADLCN